MSVFSVVTSTGRKIDVTGDRFEITTGHLSIWDANGNTVAMFQDWSSVIKDQHGTIERPAVSIQKPIASDAVLAG